MIVSVIVSVSVSVIVIVSVTVIVIVSVIVRVSVSVSDITYPLHSAPYLLFRILSPVPSNNIVGYGERVPNREGYKINRLRLSSLGFYLYPFSYFTEKIENRH